MENLSVGNVIDLRDHLRNQDHADGFRAYSLKAGENHGVISLSGGANAEKSAQAKSDLSEAGVRAERGLRVFLSAPENRLAVAAALDGLSEHERSPEQARLIDRVIDNVIMDGERPGSEDSIYIPEMQIVETEDLGHFSENPSPSALPVAVGMAYVSRGAGSDVVLFSRDLGFREVHIKSQAAIMIAFANYAERQGVNVAEGNVAGRLVAIQKGDFVDMQSDPSLYTPAGGDPIEVRYEQEIYSVPPEDYLEVPF